MVSDELIDIYDAKRVYRGTKLRKDVHRDGDWHRAFHCWIVVPGNNGQGHVILQKRSSGLANWPGVLDVSCGGHYKAGETAEDGLRELEEETGIKTSFGSLKKLKVRECLDEFQPGILNHELQDVFLLLCNQDLVDYRSRCEEQDAFVKVSIQDMIDLFTEEVDRVQAECFTLKHMDGSRSNVTTIVEVDRNQFAPTLDQYLLKTMYQVQCVLRGEDLLV